MKILACGKLSSIFSVIGRHEDASSVSGAIWKAGSPDSNAQKIDFGRERYVVDVMAIKMNREHGRMPGDYKRQAIESVADRVHFLYRLPLGSRKSTLLFTPMCVSGSKRSNRRARFAQRADVHNPFPTISQFSISIRVSICGSGSRKYSNDYHTGTKYIIIYLNIIC